MSKVSLQHKAISQRECPACGAGNMLRTRRMVSAKRALKECHSCGHRCVVNYKTNSLEEWNDE